MNADDEIVAAVTALAAEAGRSEEAEHWGSLMSFSVCPMDRHVERGATKRVTFAAGASATAETTGADCHGDGRDGEVQRGFLPQKSRDTKETVRDGIAIGAGSNLRLQPFVEPGPTFFGNYERRYLHTSEGETFRFTLCATGVSGGCPFLREADWAKYLHDPRRPAHRGSGPSGSGALTIAANGS